MRITLSLLLALSWVAITGCSFSDSSGSLSDSISSPSESISDSSSGSDSSDSSDGGSDPAPAPESADERARYQRDVSQMAVTYLKSDGEIGAFRTAISQLAQDRGITDWEADAATTQAIGVGAGTAGLEEAPFEDFSEQLFGADLAKLNELRKGYQQALPAVSAPAALSAPAAAADPDTIPSTPTPDATDVTETPEAS